MKISSATCDGVPIVLIYGGEGRGKTTLACKFPKPVAMLLERGLPRGVSVDAIDGLASYNDVLEALRALYQDPQGYQTLIIDTLDSLQPMLLDAVCAKNGCPAFVAKNRYGMAPKIPIPADFAIGELTKFWSQPREGEGE